MAVTEVSQIDEIAFPAGKDGVPELEISMYGRIRFGSLEDEAFKLAFLKV